MAMSVRVPGLMKDEQGELRCGNCNRLLGKGTVILLTIKCPRCGTMNVIQSAGDQVDQSAEGKARNADRTS